MKIHLLCNWASSEDITKRVLDQFYIDQDLSDIEFVHSGDCDFIFNFGTEVGPHGKYKQKYIFSMEPIWSGNHPRNIGDPTAIIYTQNASIVTYPHNAIECPTFMFYGAGGENWTYDTIVKNGVHHKTKNISSVVSTLRNGFERPCIYDERRAVITAILASTLDIDVYSWGPDKFPRAKGWTNKKLDGLSPYRFSVAIENSSEPNYVTEKFYDAILTNTIPIYFGAPNIKEIFPENGYILIDDIRDTNAILKLLQDINDNSEQIYNEMLPELEKIKHRYLTEFNILTFILEIARGRK